jgi:hypothetical protein
MVSGEGDGDLSNVRSTESSSLAKIAEMEWLLTVRAGGRALCLFVASSNVTLSNSLSILFLGETIPGSDLQVFNTLSHSVCITPSNEVLLRTLI